MEIGPITGIRPYPTARFKERDAEMSAVFEVENLGRAGEESYSSSHEDGTSGQEGEGGHGDGFEPEELPRLSTEVGQVNQVNFFA
jgi:hypothetical protein